MLKKVIIFSAPSGSGKTTIVKHLLQKDPRLAFSVSACTRTPRMNEIEGKDYYFLTVEEFKRKIASGEFLEHEEVYGGNYYGTLKSEVTRIWNMNKAVIFDVDVVGGLNIKKHFGEHALAVFVKPPSENVLEKRLRERLTENNATLKIRVDKAREELSFESKFEKVIINDVLEHAFMEAEQLVDSFLNQDHSGNL